MSEKKRILLIEDEENIASLIKLHGEINDEYEIEIKPDGISGYQTILNKKPDLIILDIMLPGQNGFDICRKIKNNSDTKHIPVIILTAKIEELDELLGLELGADDYITKPFSPKILFSRIKAVFRRNTRVKRNKKSLIFKDFVMEVDRYILRKKNTIISLTLSEFAILKKLLLNKHKVLTRNQLLQDLNKENLKIVERNIDVHVASLRKKLGEGGEIIETVRGVGYRCSF
ncbi:MAG: transcriptional regulator [Chlamydiae bacterium SM23_39]|nr:MAG: transcriptional regulator [Chlamydiae bacterium SM23_39]